jgi:hypothetical protein
LTPKTTRSVHKVGFISERGKAAPRNGQGAWKIGSSLFLHRVFYLVLFVEEGSQESGAEWSFDRSLQEHIHSPVKASWLSIASWHYEASPGGHDL